MLLEIGSAEILIGNPALSTVSSCHCCTCHDTDLSVLFTRLLFLKKINVLSNKTDRLMWPTKQVNIIKGELY